MSTDRHALGPSEALLTAALSGLLLAVPACSSSDSTGAGTTGTATANVNPDTPIPATTCEAGISPDPRVTSNTVVAMTEDAFKEQCGARGGLMEIQPNCGASNACRGMSYDTGTQTLTEHTCQGTNSCAGFSCVVCD